MEKEHLPVQVLEIIQLGLMLVVQQVELVEIIVEWELYMEIVVME